MIHYLLFTLYTVVILFLTYKIWIKTRQLGFVLGLFFLYYWSILGSWFIVFDELTGQKGKEFGLAYYHYLEVLFPVHADQTYLLVTFYYAFFIIIIQLTILFFSKNTRDMAFLKEEVKPIYISHFWVIVACIFSVFVSLGIVYKEILIAAKLNESIYYITRMYHGKLFTIHQLLNQVAISSLYIGFISYISKKDSIYIKGSNDKKILYFYFIAIIIVEGYLLLLGNKREIFFGGIFGILFYLKNVESNYNYRSILLFITIMVVPLFFNDGLRSYSPQFLNEIVETAGVIEETLVETTDVTEEILVESSSVDNIINDVDPELKEIKKGTYTAVSVENTVFRFLFSNEMFVPHFSMYGIMSHKVPLTYGTSLVSLVSSIVPRFLWENRPPPIYEYYAAEVGAKKGTGYTIHNAAAWYLNFGIVGIMIGAFVFGWSWTYLLHNSFKVMNMKYTFLKIFYIIGYSAFCAQVPTLLRSGPEGYKAVIVEGLILPTLVVFMASFIPNLLRKNK